MTQRVERGSQFRCWRAPFLALGLLSLSATAWAQGAPVDTSAFGAPGARCAELRYADFTHTQDAIAQISDARPMAVDGLPAFCQVEGYVWRSTRFRLRFPLEGWNGKLVAHGVGGQAGFLPNDVANARLSAGDLSRGYASMHHDGGHFSSVTDGIWAYHDAEDLMEFGFRAPYVATLASRAVIARYFGRQPTRSYYEGCSNSGREAMAMAQTYPWAFDGIVAGAPSIAAGDIFLNMFWIAEMMRDQSRTGFDMAAAQTLNRGVLAQCDERDGRRDGVIDDPRLCTVDFEPLRCGRRAAENCLTTHQIDIARRIYEGPRTAEGRQIVPSSAYPGSELAWVNFITPPWAIDYARNALRFEMLNPPPGPDFTPRIEDIESYSRRIGDFERLVSQLNPDLRRFQANGGKLISYYGWTDAFGGASNIIDYYEAAERVSGGPEATGDFFRLFMVPGMDHCGGGVGPSQFDWVDIIDRWVETDEAPTNVTGRSVTPGGPGEERTIPSYRSGAAH